jgi:hypothetical protein
LLLPGQSSLTTASTILTFVYFFFVLITCSIWAHSLRKRAVQAKLAQQPFLLPKAETISLIYR